MMKNMEIYIIWILKFKCDSKKGKKKFGDNLFGGCREMGRIRIKFPRSQKLGLGK